MCGQTAGRSGGEVVDRLHAGRVMQSNRTSLPGLLLHGAEEAANRSVIRQERQADDFGRSLGHRLIAPVPVQVDGGEARIGRVDLHARVLLSPFSIRSARGKSRKMLGYAHEG